MVSASDPKKYFIIILKDINRSYQFMESKWTSDKQYKVKFRTQLPVKNEDYEKSCDLWLEEFSHKTNTTWVNKLSNFGPKVRYRKQYQCWTYNTNNEVSLEMLFNPKKCRATLDINIFGTAPWPVKMSRYLRLGLNAIVKIHFQHLHAVDTSKEKSFFVHLCPPLPEVPRPQPASHDKVNQLVEKVIQSAPLTSQIIAERAKEIIKNLNNTPSSKQVQIDNNSQEITDPGIALAPSNTPPSISQISPHITPKGQNNKINIVYVKKLVFDSATQTIKQQDCLPSYEKIRPCCNHVNCPEILSSSEISSVVKSNS